MANPQSLKPFKKGYDERRHMKGRPRRWLSEIKEQGYRVSEVSDAIQVLISLEPAQLEEIKLNPKSTALEVAVASALLKSIQKGDLDSIETLLTRVFGKPKQEIDAKVDITSHVIKLKFGNTEDNE